VSAGTPVSAASLDLEVIQTAIDRGDGCDLIDLAPPVVEELRRLRQQRRAVLELAERAGGCVATVDVLYALGVEE
jgi:hypothetical protein